MLAVLRILKHDPRQELTVSIEFRIAEGRKEQRRNTPIVVVMSGRVKCNFLSNNAVTNEKLALEPVG